MRPERFAAKPLRPGTGPAPRRSTGKSSFDAGALETELREGLEALGVAPTARQIERLIAYLALLVRWNAVYNLTAVRDPAQMIGAHLLDCAAALPTVSRLLAQRAAQAERGAAILDVGSGAGLPGLVWAILLDSSDGSVDSHRITLVDAVEKKTAFQRQVCADLGLQRVQCIHARIETWQHPAFDLICSRAYATLRKFTDDTRHLLAREGRWMAMKGVEPVDEIASLHGIEVDAVQRLAVPQLRDAARCLVTMHPAASARPAAPADR